MLKLIKENGLLYGIADTKKDIFVMKIEPIKTIEEKKDLLRIFNLKRIGIIK